MFLAAELLECMSQICADSNVNLFDHPSNSKNSTNLAKELNELAQQLCASEPNKNWKPEKKAVVVYHQHIQCEYIYC